MEQGSLVAATSPVRQAAVDAVVAAVQEAASALLALAVASELAWRGLAATAGATAAAARRARALQLASAVSRATGAALEVAEAGPAAVQRSLLGAASCLHASRAVASVGEEGETTAERGEALVKRFGSSCTALVAFDTSTRRGRCHRHRPLRRAASDRCRDRGGSQLLRLAAERRA